MWSPQAERPRIGLERPVGAAHSPGLNYTAKAMDIGVYPAFFLVCCASDITTR